MNNETLKNVRKKNIGNLTRSEAMVFDVRRWRMVVDDVTSGDVDVDDAYESYGDSIGMTESSARQRVSAIRGFLITQAVNAGLSKEIAKTKANQALPHLPGSKRGRVAETEESKRAAADDIFAEFGIGGIEEMRNEADELMSGEPPAAQTER